jgi:RNA polymerase sigma-70 factor (ECF subfamily)
MSGMDTTLALSSFHIQGPLPSAPASRLVTRKARGVRRRLPLSAARALEAEEDVALVLRARTGERAAFTALMERYQARAYTVAFGIVRSRDDALDVVQDAFIKVHRSLDRFQGQSTFYTWLYRIVVNLCIDQRRKRARSRTEVMDNTAPEHVNRAAEFDGTHRPGTKPNQNAEDRELGRHIQAAMEQLTENHRAILLLREVDGLSYDELAQVLEISKGTVMSRLFHARQNMQRLLRPALGLNDGQPLLVAPATGGNADKNEDSH